MADDKQETMGLSDLTGHDISESIVSSSADFVAQVVDSIEFHHGKLDEKSKTQLFEKLNNWLEESALKFEL